MELRLAALVAALLLACCALQRGATAAFLQNELPLTVTLTTPTELLDGNASEPISVRERLAIEVRRRRHYGSSDASSAASSAAACVPMAARRPCSRAPSLRLAPTLGKQRCRRRSCRSTSTATCRGGCAG